MVLATRVYSLQGERVFEIEEGGPEGGCNIPGVAPQNREGPGIESRSPDSPSSAL